MTRGQITSHYGVEMWRPLVDIRDVARAYIASIEADVKKVRGGGDLQCLLRKHAHLRAGVAGH